MFLLRLQKFLLLHTDMLVVTRNIIYADYLELLRRPLMSDSSLLVAFLVAS